MVVNAQKPPPTRSASQTRTPRAAKSFARNLSRKKSGSQVLNLDESAFARMASDAEKNCPVSKVLKAAITLDGKLI